jgi:hypothetical protein
MDAQETENLVMALICGIHEANKIGLLVKHKLLQVIK